MQKTGSLYGSSLSKYLSELLNKAGGKTGVICKDESQARLLASEVSLFGYSGKVLHFPDLEILAFDRFLPNKSIVSKRITVLSELLTSAEPLVLFISCSNLLKRVPNKSYIQAGSYQFKVGNELDIRSLIPSLSELGYYKVQQVVEPGQYALRGEIFDLYAIGQDLPVRICFNFDEIERLKLFDPKSQLTIKAIDSFQILPAFEQQVDEQAWRRAMIKLKQEYMDYTAYSVYSMLRNKDLIATELVPHWLSEFSSSSIVEYAKLDWLKVDEIEIEQKYANIKSRYEQAVLHKLIPDYGLEQLYQSPSEVFFNIKCDRALSQRSSKHNAKIKQIPDIKIDYNKVDKLVNFKKILQPETKICLCVAELSRVEILKTILAKNGVSSVVTNSIEALSVGVNILLFPIREGFFDWGNNIYYITEFELNGRIPEFFIAPEKTHKHFKKNNILGSVLELEPGTLVVHIKFGIGVYRGLKNIQISENIIEFIELEYSCEDKIYVPVYELHKISKYTGIDPELVKISSLKSDKWNNQKQAAFKKIHDSAANLMQIYAERASKNGFSLEPQLDELQLFINKFPYIATEDQTRAFSEVKDDLLMDKPMDRLICGDVGFGKTEVAMRAAFIAISAGKQVAVLVPTTLLVEQHYESFYDRFNGFAISIGILSRFKTKAEQEQTIAKINNGSYDLVIGTHKLLDPSLKFKDLGLIIVDEEHRFGVKQKEELTKRRLDVNILTMTATPIPRTLNSALSGIRDLSLITTAPRARLPVKTFVHEYDELLINDSISRELNRGGQVYFVHNDITTINSLAKKVAELIPDSICAIAHGQMREIELEKIMLNFKQKRINVLFCTTIIETGIDIGSANTIIVNKAENFGLAQMHQLRGRVGRSFLQGYAYFLFTAEKKLPKDASKRLEVLQKYQDLGSGFMLANHDLEIRGAGELLGCEQSGNIASLGSELYLELLQKACNLLSSEQKFSDLDELLTEVEVDYYLTTIIPETYINDVVERMSIYKRMGGAKDAAALHEIKSEVFDRYGKFPKEFLDLMMITEFKLNLPPRILHRVEIKLEQSVLYFRENAKISLERLLDLIKEPEKYALKAQTNLVVKSAVGLEQVDILNNITDVLQELVG